MRDQIDYSGIYVANRKNINTQSIENIGTPSNKPDSVKISFNKLIAKIDKINDNNNFEIGTQYKGIILFLCPITGNNLKLPEIQVQLVSYIQLPDGSIRGTPTFLGAEEEKTDKFLVIENFYPLKTKSYGKVRKPIQLQFFNNAFGKILDTRLSGSIFATFKRSSSKEIPRPIIKFLDKFFDGKTNEVELKLIKDELAKSLCQNE